MVIDPRFIDAAQRSHAKVYPKGPFTSVILAQFGIESAWGKEPSGKNNYFGIKANHLQIDEGKCTIRLTHETTSSGQYVKIPQYFADYDNLEACFDAHASLLCTPHYLDCQHARTPEEYCHALWKDGYATGIPKHPYDEVLIDIINTMKLKQYDLPHATVIALKEKIMSDNLVATVNVSASTPAQPARVVPTMLQPTRIPWIDALEQFLVHEEPLAVAAAQMGLNAGAASIPVLGPMLIATIGPTVAKDAVDAAIKLSTAGLDTLRGTADVINTDNVVLSMAAQIISSGAPTFFAKSSDLLGGWFSSALASSK